MADVKLHRYRLPSERGEGWAIVVLDSLGFFAAVSDFGNYAHGWPAHGERDFRLFVADLVRDPDYTRRKLVPATEWPVDVDATVRECKRAIFHSRRNGRMDAGDARLEYETLQNAEADGEAAVIAWIWESRVEDKGELEQRRPSSDLVAFTERLMPRLAEVIRAELKAEAEVQAEPPKYLIRSLYHEDGDLLVWWRPEGAGYTCALEEAGRYTREDAESRCAGADRNVPVPEAEAVAAAARVVRVPSSLGKEVPRG